MRQHADKISHLVVLGTIINEHGFNHPNIDPGFFTRELMHACSSELTSAAVLEKTFNNLGLTGQYKLSEDECHGYVEPMREGSDTALYQFFTHINKDLFSWLEQNRTLFKGYPGGTLVLWGGKDKGLTAKQIPILQETLNIPQHNIHIYPQHSHFLAEEMPDEIVQKVSEFILPKQ